MIAFPSTGIRYTEERRTLARRASERRTLARGVRPSLMMLVSRAIEDVGAMLKALAAGAPTRSESSSKRRRRACGCRRTFARRRVTAANPSCGQPSDYSLAAAGGYAATQL